MFPHLPLHLLFCRNIIDRQEQSFLEVLYYVSTAKNSFCVMVEEAHMQLRRHMY